MTIVDLTKARAYADSRAAAFTHGPDQSAEWIHELADEVESLDGALRLARTSEQAALADAARLAEENDLLRTALVELLHQVSELVKGLS